MKSRHAVALALVGWYLMVPPKVPYTDHNGRVSIPPFSREWRVLTITNTEDDCARNLKFALIHEKKVSMGEMREAVRYGGMCVRDDDPRSNPNPPTLIPEDER